jgi:hypothetical protein
MLNNLPLTEDGEVVVTAPTIFSSSFAGIGSGGFL